MLDGLLPWGLTFAAKASWASGFPRRLVDCTAGFSACVTREGDSPSFRQLDVGVGKELAWGIHRFSLRADVLNVFNSVNYGGFDDFIGGPAPAGGPANAFGGDNANLHKPNSLRGEMRTLRLALGYRF